MIDNISNTVQWPLTVIPFNKITRMEKSRQSNYINGTIIMNNILFSQIGKIIEGKHKNWFIEVIDDTNHTGGYYVLICESKSFINNVYD